MLEGADHEHLRVAGENILGAVTVMHVEIDDRHAFQSVRVQRVARRDGNIVEETESHRACALRMVSRRPNCASRSRLHPS